jgi:cyclopropane fatty-acyl-phospholipid synthase-like methyltransferase
MLDIGGGSGSHSIGAVRRWSQMQAIIFEMPVVCEVAEQYIAQYGMQRQIETYAGDMWNDPFPPADLHFYADIYHDWPLEKCRFLAEKSFASLEAGGRIIIHEMLLNDEKTGPFTVAGYAIAMLLWTEGQQFSGRELSTMLDEAGFIDIEVKPTSGYWHIVTGRKP